MDDVKFEFNDIKSTIFKTTGHFKF